MISVYMMNTLPIELIVTVAGFSSLQGKYTLGLLCKEYANLLNEQSEIWKHSIPDVHWEVQRLEGNKVKWALYQDYLNSVILHRIRNLNRLGEATPEHWVRYDRLQNIDFSILHDHYEHQRWKRLRRTGRRKYHNIFSLVLDHIGKDYELTEETLLTRLPYTWKPSKNSKTNILIKYEHLKNDNVPDIYIELLEKESKRCESIKFVSKTNWKIVWVNGKLLL